MTKFCSGRSSVWRSITSWSERRLRWKATTSSVTETIPNRSATPSSIPALFYLLDEGLGLDLRLRVVVALCGPHDRAPVRDVELVHLVGLPQVQVDRPRVDGGEGALRLDEAEQLPLGGVDDGEAVRGGRAERDGGRGEAGPARKVAAVSLTQLARRHQPLCVLLEVGAEHAGVVGLERRLVRRRDEMAHVDRLRAVVEDRRLHGTAEELVRVAAEELVQRVVARDVERRARARSRRPARPHCWRRLATVPGKVTEIAASRCPMSIPSSSALVATTPSRSPPARRCSISRRCCGV